MLIVIIRASSRQIWQAGADCFVLDLGCSGLQVIPNRGDRTEEVGNHDGDTGLRRLTRSPSGVSSDLGWFLVLSSGLQERSDDSPSGEDDSISSPRLF